MKKLSLVLAGLVLIGLVYTFESAQGGTNAFAQDTAPEYIIIKYFPTLSAEDVIVYSGANKIQHFPPSKEQKQDFGRLNLVIDLMNKYSAEGYTLISTTTGAGGTDCFLRKTK